MRVPFSLYSCQCLVFSDKSKKKFRHFNRYWILIGSGIESWFLTCISLITVVFHSLFAIHIFSLVSCLFKRLFVFLLSFEISGYRSCVRYWFIVFFSHFVAYIFIFLMKSTEFLISMKSSLSLFFFYESCFWCYTKKFLPISNVANIFCFLLEVFKLHALI
jgi:hypothetical protein